MGAYRRVPLGEICAINPRPERASLPAGDAIVSFVPMAAIDERSGAIAVREERPLSEVSKGYTAFEDGDVLFAKITPCMENGKAALARNLANGTGRGSTEFYVLRPGGEVCGEYVYHFVRQPSFREAARRSFTGTAGQQRVPRSFMESVSVPLPPLGEQRRIAGILNRAARIERLRARAADRLDGFAPALFASMFGDPADNPMGWRTAPIGDACDVIGGGTPRRSEAAYFGGGIPWATPTDVTELADLHIGRTKETITETGLRKSSARLAPAGTVLLTSRATIGFTAIAARPMATNQGFANLVCGDGLTPEYLAHWLAARRDLLIRLAGGTTFKEISKATLKKIPIPLPPMALQRDHARTLETARGVASRARAATRTATPLTASLMDRLLDGNPARRPTS